MLWLTVPVKATEVIFGFGFYLCVFLLIRVCDALTILLWNIYSLRRCGCIWEKDRGETERSGSVTGGGRTAHRQKLQSITADYIHPPCVFQFPCAPTWVLIVLTGTWVQGEVPPNLLSGWGWWSRKGKGWIASYCMRVNHSHSWLNVLRPQTWMPITEEGCWTWWREARGSSSATSKTTWRTRWRTRPDRSWAKSPRKCPLMHGTQQRCRLLLCGFTPEMDDRAFLSCLHWYFSCLRTNCQLKWGSSFVSFFFDFITCRCEVKHLHLGHTWNIYLFLI